MKPPRIPPLLADLVQTALVLPDNREFTTCPSCPLCGGSVQGYDLRKKRFAVLREPERTRIVTVRVKRFVCRACGMLCYANEPFYPDTRIGSPVVDLCRVLAMNMPASRTATYLAHLGIVVDRWTVRNYLRSGPAEIPIANFYGLQIPFSILTLANLAARSGSRDRVRETEILSACGFLPADGNLPIRQRGPGSFP